MPLPNRTDQRSGSRVVWSASSSPSVSVHLTVEFARTSLFGMSTSAWNDDTKFSSVRHLLSASIRAGTSQRNLHLMTSVAPSSWVDLVRTSGGFSTVHSVLMHA